MSGSKSCAVPAKWANSTHHDILVETKHHHPPRGELSAGSTPTTTCFAMHSISPSGHRHKEKEERKNNFQTDKKQHTTVRANSGGKTSRFHLQSFSRHRTSGTNNNQKVQCSKSGKSAKILTRLCFSVVVVAVDS